MCVSIQRQTYGKHRIKQKWFFFLIMSSIEKFWKRQHTHKLYKSPKYTTTPQKCLLYRSIYKDFDPPKAMSSRKHFIYTKNIVYIAALGFTKKYHLCSLLMFNYTNLIWVTLKVLRNTRSGVNDTKRSFPPGRGGGLYSLVGMCRCEIGKLTHVFPGNVRRFWVLTKCTLILQNFRWLLWKCCRVFPFQIIVCFLTIMEELVPG